MFIKRFPPSPSTIATFVTFCFQQLIVLSHPIKVSSTLIPCHRETSCKGNIVPWGKFFAKGKVPYTYTRKIQPTLYQTRNFLKYIYIWFLDLIVTSHSKIAGSLGLCEIIIWFWRFHFKIEYSCIFQNLLDFHSQRNFLWEKYFLKISSCVKTT
jgi:hypothetical protein